MRTDLAERYRWQALGVATLAFASFAAVLIAIPVLAPELRDRFQLSVGEVGIMIACLEIGMAVSLIGWGEAADRLGERTTLIAGLIGAGIAVAAAAYSPTPGVLFGGLLVAGMCGSAVSAAGPRLVLALFAVDERGQALAIRQSAVPVTGIVVALVMGPIAIHFGTEASLTLLALPLLATAALAAWRLRGGRPRARALDRTLSTYDHPRRNPTVWRVSASGGLMLTGQAVLIGFTTIFLVDERGVSTAGAGAIVAGMLAVGGLMLLALSRWSDRHTQRLRPMRWVCCALALGFALLGVLQAAETWILVLILGATGAISLSWLTLPTAVLGSLVTQPFHGAAMGIQQAALAVMAALTPVAFGWSAETFSWGTGFVGTGTVMLIAWALVWRLNDPPETGAPPCAR